MELKVTGEGAESYEEVMLIYSGALKQINTKLEILNQEFQHVHNYNPIEHIKSRVKTPGSIAAKLKRHGYEVTLANMVKYCNDIAGSSRKSWLTLHTPERMCMAPASSFERSSMSLMSSRSACELKSIPST